MHYSTIALTLLASTGVLAAPLASVADTSVKVLLSSSTDDSTSTSVEFSSVTSAKTASLADLYSNFAFDTVALTVGKDAAKQDLRCKVVDFAGNDIPISRGTNIDVAFSDAGKGAWTFLTPSEVGAIVCDPTFEKITPEALADGSSLRVVLSNQQTETGSQTALSSGMREEAAPIGSSGPFETVELRVGKFVQKKDYRCQILDMTGFPIDLTRGTSGSNTFSDAGKGEWTLNTVAEVSTIICDPTFAK
ncbi:hypothetical protein LTR84_009729 [Exophiala bonariae]|uniref:Ubiquitin 3 binding protein But2 C-terminal domain-containing protein n=1 Tax=Exophiala bonariae TaxID=1690606 RepID=A0AAV9NNC9_9EURO|nr:hypothetical protein LTR84_009729 [Exophiala bonariae]